MPVFELNGHKLQKLIHPNKKKMSILFITLDMATHIVTLWIPLVLTLSTIFEINIIYKRTIKGYYETQEFRYQGEKVIDTEEELAKFHKGMHRVLQKNISLHRYGLKRLHLCEFWCIYWMLTFAINEEIAPFVQHIGIPKVIIKVLKFLAPFALYVYVHERPSHKNSEPERPWSFPKLLAELYKFGIIPVIKSVSNIMMSTITEEKVHTTIKHVNGTIAASDFNMFETESKPIFYFQSYSENSKQPTTISIANMIVEPDSVIASSRSSLVSHISPVETLYRENSTEKPRLKTDSRRKIVMRLNDLFRHKN